MNVVAQITKELAEPVLRMVLDQIVEQFHRRNRSGQMIIEISAETLGTWRFLFAHKNLSRLAIDEAAPRSHL
jgi:proline dehydrogenase